MVQLSLRSPERRWYLLFRDGDRQLITLLGPFKDGEDSARTAMAMLLALDGEMTNLIDWTSPDICVPYLYSSVEVMDLSSDEVAAMAGTAQA
jgi:hypothetical protein